MPILRLAYATQFLIAVLAVFVLWSEVGGQSHLDLMPWYLKLGLGGGAAFAVVKATAASVEKKQAWNGGTLRWFGILLALLLGCGLASYYYHVYGESDEDDQDDTITSMVVPLRPAPALQFRQIAQGAPAGPFGAHFRHYDPVAFMQELAQDVLQLRRRVGAVQRPLVGQDLARFKGAQAGLERRVVAFVQQVARDQV